LSFVQCVSQVRFFGLDGNLGLQLGCNIDKNGTYQKITIAYLKGGPKCSNPCECLRILVEISRLGL
jgi:hypothetical protein